MMNWKSTWRSARERCSGSTISLSANSERKPPWRISYDRLKRWRLSAHLPAVWRMISQYSQYHLRLCLVIGTDGSGPAIADAVRPIKDMAQRGASLVRQLLAIAQKTDAKFEITDLNILVKNVTELLAQTFPKNIDVDVELDPKVSSIMLDSNQITQAIINLCVNARDAMPNGGRLLVKTQSLGADEAKQRFVHAEESPYVCIAVSDAGMGIPKEAQEHL